MTDRVSISQLNDEISSPAEAGRGTILEGSSNTEIAVNRLYKKHAKALSNYLRSKFGDGPPDPDDVVQDAFAKLIDRDDLRDIKNPQAFIWKIARNVMLSGRRKIDVRSKYDFEVEHLFFASSGSELSPERVIEVRDQLEIINAAINKMPENRRLAFLMHRVEGLNFSAIGRRLGMSSNGAVKHVTRAAHDIKVALKDRPQSPRSKS